MNQLMEVYETPQVIRMDSGSEMTWGKYKKWSRETGVTLLFIHPGKPNHNASVGRFDSSFRDEVLDANLFNSIAEVQEAADVWVMDYNEFRHRNSLGNKTPTEFMLRTFKTGIFSFESST